METSPPHDQLQGLGLVCLVNLNTESFPRNRKELFPDGVNLIETMSTKCSIVDSVLCFPNFSHPLKDLDTHFPSCTSPTCKQPTVEFFTSHCSQFKGAPLLGYTPPWGSTHSMACPNRSKKAVFQPQFRTSLRGHPNFIVPMESFEFLLQVQLNFCLCLALLPSLVIVLILQRSPCGCCYQECEKSLLQKLFPKGIQSMTMITQER